MLKEPYAYGKDLLVDHRILQVLLCTSPLTLLLMTVAATDSDNDERAASRVCVNIHTNGWVRTVCVSVSGSE